MFAAKSPSSLESHAWASQSIAPRVSTDVDFEYKSKQQLHEFLERHQAEHVDVRIANIVEMMADLQGVSRAALLRTAITAWFFRALGLAIMEVECHEQERGDSCDSGGGLVLFRVRLDASHDAELAKLESGQSLAASYRERLVQALPGDLAKLGLDDMIQISWTRSGSVELGGVAATAIVALIVIAIGLGICRDPPCLCKDCPCLARAGHTEGAAYASAVHALQERGAEFAVDPDGSARLLIPPQREHRAQCFECCIL